MNKHENLFTLNENALWQELLYELLHQKIQKIQNDLHHTPTHTHMYIYIYLYSLSIVLVNNIYFLSMQFLLAILIYLFLQSVTLCK